MVNKSLRSDQLKAILTFQLTFLTNFRPERTQEFCSSAQPHGEQNQQSLALNVTSESSFEHGNNNKSADAVPCDKPMANYKCKF